MRCTKRMMSLASILACGAFAATLIAGEQKQIPSSGLFVNGNLGVGVQAPHYRLELPNIADPTGQARANSWQTYSSIRWKEDITPIGDALSKVLAMRGVFFNWKMDHGGYHDIGFIAEEVGHVVPELVNWEQDGEYALGLKYDRVTALLVEAVKEQQRQIDSQQQMLERQQGQIEQQGQIIETQQTQILDHREVLMSHATTLCTVITSQTVIEEKNRLLEQQLLLMQAQMLQMQQKIDALQTQCSSNGEAIAPQNQ